MTDIPIIPLQIMYREDGMALTLSENLLLGEYDIEKGLLFKFYLRNPNADLEADISNIKSVNDDWTFVGPQIIQPLESAQVLLRISPIDNLEKLGVEPMKSPEFPSDHGQLKGSVKWARPNKQVMSQ